MQNIRSIFSQRITKGIIDILLIVGLVISFYSAHQFTDNISFGSFHCVVSMVWYALMLIHIGQHWKMIKLLVKGKVFRKNILTSLTGIAFIFLTITIVSLWAGIKDSSIHIHHDVSKAFTIIVIIHTVVKAKRLLSLFKKNTKTRDAG